MLKSAPNNTLPPMGLRQSIATSPQAISIYFNQIVYDLRRKGDDVTTLSLGEAFFDIPFFDFQKLDFTKGYHYSDSQGLPELRAKLASYYSKHYGARVDPDKELLISAGSKPLIFMAMLSVMETGDEVLIHEPAWLSYPEQASLAGLTYGFIPFNCPVESFHKHFSKKTRMLIVNNPNNPAGKLYTREELSSLYEQCRPRGIYVMVDEAYSDFVVDGNFASMASVVPNKDGVIIVNSLSKNMGISGWRIGYIISSEDVIESLLKVNQHLITCAPTILLQYCTKYFDEMISITLPQVRDVVEKRKRVEKMLTDLDMVSLPGGTTFYFFVGIQDYVGTSLEFSLSLLLEEKISVVPGSAYGKSTDRFVRISIGTESEERIWEALVIIKRHIEKHKFDKLSIESRLKVIGQKLLPESKTL
tara:strand:- start:411 stop:1661 length:1251 start_codon:yes stop_codon:yes gene_type:complete